MTTVISITEFKKLSVSKTLVTSENTKFISNEHLRRLIMKQIEPVVGHPVKTGFITVLSGANGDLSTDSLKKNSNEILLKLPRPPEAIYLTMDDDLPCVRIDHKSLLDLIKMDLADPQIQELAESFFQGKEELGVDYHYGFLPQLNLSWVKEVIYDPSLADKVREVQDNVAYEEIVFSETTLFNRN